MKGTKIRNRFFALILALVMVISIVTVSASAATTDNNDATSEQKYTTKLDDPVDIYESVTIENDGAGEITEIVSLRQESAKHFKLPDGTCQAVYYASPVHRKDASGTWQDIDNSLTLKSNSTTFSTSDNRMNFAERFVPNESLFTLSENGYSVSMTLIENTLSSGSLATMNAADTATLAPQAAVTNAPQRQTRWESIDDAVAINNSGSIKYNSIRQSTDLEYVLVGNEVKENIIVNAPLESYVYNFRLDVSGLQATLEANGNVSLKDIETGKTKYRIPAPYMFDANGVVSYAVSYGLVELPNGSYVLTVTADTEWINDSARTFPVTIDPTLHPVSDSYDTFVYSGEPTENYGTEAAMQIGAGTQGYIYIDLYDLPEDAIIQNAKLHTYYYFTSGSSGQYTTIRAYEIMSSWDETSVTWDTKPTVSSTILGASTLTYSSMTYNSPSTTWFYITDAVEGWLDGTTENYGIALSSVSSSSPYVFFKTYESGTSFMPSISIMYEYFFEGVYGIENVFWDNQYMTASGTAATSNTIVKGANFSDSTFTTEFRPLSLFKITNVRETEQYIIRSMYDNSLGLSVSDGELVFKQIPLVDNDVPNADTFIIQWDGRGYQIRPYGTTDILYLSGASQNVTTESQSEITSAARWMFTRYSRTEYGYEIHSAPTEVLLDSRVSFSIKRVWSTSIAANTPYMYIPSESESLATVEWVAAAKTLYVTANELGVIPLVVAIRIGQEFDEYTWTISFVSVIEDGEYYILNKQTDNLLQLNTYTDFAIPGTFLISGVFTAANYQRMEITHCGDGYYSIISSESNLALGIAYDERNVSGANVIQGSIDNASGPLNEQLWFIERSELMNFVIRPYYSQDFCLSVLGTAQQVLYSDDENVSDEWSLISTRVVGATVIIADNMGFSHSHTQQINLIIRFMGRISDGDLRYYIAPTVTEWLIYLTTSKMFFFFGHGREDGVLLNGSSEYGDVAVTSTIVNNLESQALINCQLIVYCSCRTGADFGEEDNFMDVTYSKGATAVLGFKINMKCCLGVNWCSELFRRLYLGQSLEDATGINDETPMIPETDLYILGARNLSFD